MPSPEALARAFAGWVGADPEGERVARGSATPVVFRPRPGGRAVDDPRLGGLNERLRTAANASGAAFLTAGVRQGRSVLQLAVRRRAPGERHVQRAWAILRAEARRLGALPPVLADGEA
jgi:hypothetical protein